MVDAQTGKNPFFVELRDISMVVFEDVLILDVETDEAVDGEEAAVIDAPVRFLPMAKPVVLRLRELSGFLCGRQGSARTASEDFSG